MKRIKVEAIFHVADSENVQTFGDRIVEHMTQFRISSAARSKRGPDYEECVVSVERKEWDQAVKDTKR